MKKRTKEFIVIGLLFVLALGGYFFITKYNTETDHIEVRGKGDVVLLKAPFDVNDTYEIEVKGGHMHLEVKDGEYRVFDVDCPDKICEKEGWIEKGQINRVIHCLPNEVYVVQIEK